MGEFLPDLEIRHERQTLGMEGPNLAEKRRRQILKRAPETPLGKIQKMDDSHFEVQSSKTDQSYHIDLNTITCNCKDFPRIRLCKHIAAVAHFFGGVDLGPRPPDNAASEPVVPSSPVQQNGSDGTDDDATACFISAANDMIRLTQELISNAPHNRGIAKSFTKSVNSMRSRLSALILSATATATGDGSHLPEKENIGPNQLSWPETAAQMGVKRGNKRQGKGKVDSALTAQHIGEPNRKRAADNDPYGAGEQSGKRAKPDARSAAANARVRAAEEQAVLKAEPPCTQPPPTQPPSMQLPPMQPPFTHLPSTQLSSTQLPPTLPPFTQPPFAHPPTPLTHPPPPPLASLPLSAPPPHGSFPLYTYNPYYFHPPHAPQAPLSQPYRPQAQQYYHAFPFSTYST